MTALGDDFEPGLGGRKARSRAAPVGLGSYHNGVDFDQGSAWQSCRLDRCSRRRLAWEAATIDPVNGRKVTHVAQVNRAAYNVLETTAGRSEHRLKVFHDLFGLGGYIASAHKLSGFGRQRNLPRTKHKVAGHDGLRVRPDRRWCQRGRDYGACWIHRTAFYHSSTYWNFRPASAYDRRP